MTPGAPPSRRARVTVEEVARRLSVSRKTIRNLLAEHRAEFSAPVYGRVGRHPRRLRLLTGSDCVRLDRLISRDLS